VNAVDDPANASAFLSGVVRRDGVTLAISTSGDAPALTALLREALDAMLPSDLAAWIARARAERVIWRRDRVPMDLRKPRLLQALNALYQEPAADRPFDTLKTAADGGPAESHLVDRAAAERSAHVPWLNAPEDSWL
jgi:uroporphyrin-III C-methyltransferase/precorrin-2 dehydrogenase/sirohydrochlorin ferrochelatase